MSSSVRLVWITPDAEKLISRIAQMSEPTHNADSSPLSLFKMIIQRGYWSPFEMASACLEVKTSRAICAQILRHRSFSFHEFSQRTVAVPADNLSMPSLRLQKPNEGDDAMDTRGDADLPDVEKVFFSDRINVLFHNAFALYKEMIEAGIAKECARFVLPLASQSTIYMSGNIRSWIHYIALRTQLSTQNEHRNVALAARQVLSKELPIISQVFQWHLTPTLDSIDE